MRPALLGAIAPGATPVGPFFVGSGAIPAFSDFASRGGGAYNIALPTGLQQNDIILAAFSTDSFGAMQDPSEQWQLASTTLFDRFTLFWIRRGASNPPTAFNASSASISSFCVAYRGCATGKTPYEGYGETSVASSFGDEVVTTGGPLQALSVRPNGTGRVILNFLQTVITAPAVYDNVPFGGDIDWINRLDAIPTGTAGGLSETHCWAVREIAGASGVSQGGVTFSGGIPDFANYGSQAQRYGTAYSLALL